MKKYEIMYILRADLEEAARKEEMSKLQGILESLKGKVTETKEWGMRDFAYTMKDQKKGYYVILKVTADQPALDEFNRQTRFNSNVIRYLITVDQD